MFDHISIGVRDVAKAKAFYDAALKPLELTCLSADETSFGYGKEAPRFWSMRPSAPYPTIPSPDFISASPRRAGKASRRSIRRRWRMADATMASPACARIVGRIITRPSSMTPRAIGSKPIMEGNNRWRPFDPKSRHARR